MDTFRTTRINYRHKNLTSFLDLPFFSKMFLEGKLKYVFDFT